MHVNIWMMKCAVRVCRRLLTNDVISSSPCDPRPEQTKAHPHKRRQTRTHSASRVHGTPAGAGGAQMKRKQMPEPQSESEPLRMQPDTVAV